jgi:hypothetical protein
MANFIYDKLNDFGYIAGPLAAGDFPNIINLVDAKADRMTVDLLADKDVDGGTELTVTVRGADSETGNYIEVGGNHFTLAELQKGVCRVAISPNQYQFLKVSIVPSGNFTGGGARALINSYIGK